MAEAIFGMICPLKIYKIEKNDELSIEETTNELLKIIIGGIIKK